MPIEFCPACRDAHQPPQCIPPNGAFSRMCMPVRIYGCTGVHPYMRMAIRLYIRPPRGEAGRPGAK